MKNFYATLIFLCSFSLLNSNLKAQTISTTESRCVNTGTATINGTVGAGGPYQLSIISAPADYINTGIHSVANLPEEFNALYPGSYTMKVIDKNGISFTYPFTITGNYVLPGNNDYLPTTTAVTNCASPNGSIQGILTTGRAPYNYTIVSGPAQVGVTNATGTFNNLPAGNYRVQAGDSCQNLQTRNVTIAASTTSYSITGGTITKIGCDSFSLDALTVSPLLPAGASYQIADYANGYRVLTSGTNLPLHFKAASLDITGGYIAITLSNGCGVLASTDGIRTIANEPVYTIANPVINRTGCDSFTLASLDLSPGLPPGGHYEIHAYHSGAAVTFSGTSLPINFTTTTNNDIPDGWVSIIVYDACGNAITYIQPSTVANDWNLISASISQDCTNGVVLHSVTTTGTITSPYTVTVQPYYADPSGNIIYPTPPQTVTGYPYTLTGVDGTTNPLYINTIITDACGVTKQVGNNLSFSLGISGAIFNDCSNTRTDIYPAGDTSTAGPVTYSISPNAGTGSNFNGGYSFVVPDGDYTITAKDACGKTFSLQITADHKWKSDIYAYLGCSIGKITNEVKIPRRSMGNVTVYQYEGGMPVSGSSVLLSTQIFNSEDGTNGLATSDLSEVGGTLKFDALPNQTCTYVLVDRCGKSDTVSIVNRANSHQPMVHTTRVVNKCINKGDIYGTWSSDNEPWAYAIIQIWEKNTPGTIIKELSVPNTSTESILVNDVPPGTYIVQYALVNCGPSNYFYDTAEVTPYVQPRVTTIQSFTPCSGGGSPVIVTGTGGVGPYMYEVVNSTPDHYTAPVQTSSVFVLPTTQTTVTVRVLDACLNSTTRTVSVTKAPAPFIRTTPSIVSTCALPLNYTLYTDSLYNGSVFAWTKLTGTGADSTVIIGTSPSLALTFNSITDTGTYQVRVTVPGSCFDVNSRFTVSNIIVTCAPGISGNVFDDANGLTDSIVNGIGTDAGSLNAILVNSSNQVIATTVVASNGSYNFSNVGGGTYSVVLSTTSGTINAAPPVASLPSNWVNTGEHLGTTAGNDGIVNGILTNIIVSGAVNAKSVTDADFGIEQLPVAVSIVDTAQVNPGGMIQVSVPTLNGSDPEDGTYDGISDINTIVIDTLPTKGTLYYNGTAVTAGQIITNYDPTMLTVDPKNGAITVTFTYSEVDAAGKASVQATVTMPFTTLNLSGNVFDDFNGLTDNTVNGTGIGLPSNIQLYANLLDPAGRVIGVFAVNNDGSYHFSNLNAGNDTVQISTISGISGNLAPAKQLPANWVNTGENIGIAAGNDGIINGLLPVTLTTTDITNANFGIDQLPNSDDKTYTITTPAVNSKIVLNGTGMIPGALSGTDPEDGIMRAGKTVVITTVPNNSQLYYNGVLVINNTTINNYDSSLLEIKFTSTGSTGTSFQYAYVDSAGKQDTTPATYTITWTTPLPVKLISFTAKKEEDNSVLNWATAGELNAKTFNVERSTNNGKSWQPIGEVMATGNSTGNQSYSFTDANPENGSNLYRLQIEDNNGTYTYSNTVQIYFDSQSSMSVYPNPVGQEAALNIQLTGLKQGTYKISLVASSGQTIKQMNFAISASGAATLVIPTGNIPAGSYIVIVNGNDKTWSKTVVIANR